MRITLFAAAMGLGLASAAQAQHSLNLSTAQGPQDPMVIAMEEAKTRIEALSNGAMTINIFHSAQLGEDNDIIEQIRAGANIAALVDAGRLAQFQPEMGILAAPYLVDSYTQYAAITASPPFQAAADALAANSGLRLLNYNWYQGARHMLTRQLVERPEDLAGLRVRTINTPGWIGSINAMGATATPLPWAEIYPALQSGVIDGAEAQLTGAFGIRLHEVVTNVALTNHIQLFTGFVTSESWLQSVPAELRDILVEELATAGDEATRMTVAALDRVTAEMTAAGVAFNEVDQEPFRERVQSVYDAMGWSATRDELLPFIQSAGN